MTTPPIQALTDELLGEIEAAAKDVCGWTMREYFQEPEEGFLPDDWEWYVGSIDEDGNRYPLLNVNAHQYDSEDSEKLAKYYAMVNRDDVLAMVTELRTQRAENAAHVSFIAKQVATIRELRKDAGRYRWYKKNARYKFYADEVIDLAQDGGKLDTAIDTAMQVKP
jgi:hypothetical protein